MNGIPTRIKLIDTAGQVGFPVLVDFVLSQRCSPSLSSNPAGFPQQEEFGLLRSLCYAHVDVFILCFSLVNPVSFRNVTSKWIPQIRAGNPVSPIVLVGTQSDLCHDVDVLIRLDQRGAEPVAHSRARRLARRIGAQDYVECSALTQRNLKDVFDGAVHAAISHKNSGKTSKRLGPLKRLKAFCNSGWREIFSLT